MRKIRKQNWYRQEKKIVPDGVPNEIRSNVHIHKGFKLHAKL